MGRALAPAYPPRVGHVVLAVERLLAGRVVSLDYFGRWKALHYAARRFLPPCCLIRTPRASRSLSAALLSKNGGNLRWALTTLAGEVLASGDKPVRVEPMGVTAVENLDFARFLDDDTRRDLVFVAELWQGDRRLAVQTAFFVPTKYLALVDPHIQAKVALRTAAALSLSALAGPPGGMQPGRRRSGSLATTISICPPGRPSRSPLLCRPAGIWPGPRRPSPYAPSTTPIPGRTAQQKA